jgi:flagellar hook assembly protein FlgD
MGGSTKCDDIIALGLTGVNEYGSQTINGFTAYPNPFSDRTTISYVVGSGGYHTQKMRVYDSAGRLITDLGLSPVTEGMVSATWDGSDGFGNRVAPGVYFIRDDSGRQIEKVVKLH